MAVPTYSGNAFNQSLGGMADIFGRFAANKAANISNQTLAQQNQLALQHAMLQNAGQDTSNQTAQYNLQNMLPQEMQAKQEALQQAQRMNPLAYQQAQMGVDQTSKMNPIQLAIAQQQQVQSQNTNDLFPLQKQHLNLENQGLGINNRQQQNLMQSGLMPVMGPNGQVTYQPMDPVARQQLTGKQGAAIMNPDGTISYAPQTQALSQGQQMDMARKEYEPIHKEILSGIAPYQGMGGKAKLAADMSLYNLHLASPDTIERLKAYNASAALVPTFYAALGRSATGGVPSSTEMEHMATAYGFPQSGISLRGEDNTGSQERVAQILHTAGQDSVGAATHPFGGGGSPSSSSSSPLSQVPLDYLQKIAGGK